jgi:protein-disulfide isomerase
VSVSRLIDGLTGVIAVAAICGTGYVLLRKQPEDATTGIASVTASESNIANRGGHIIGSTAAEIVIVEFADFQCPFCDSMKATLDSLRRLHPSVAVRFRHMPNSRIHPYAMDAAVASECAAQQRRFPEYHDMLYKESQALGVLSWTLLAARVHGIDTLAFRDCLNMRAAAASAVAKDIADADELRIQGTPAFFIGRHRSMGAVPFRTLVEAVDAERVGTPKQ